MNKLGKNSVAIFLAAALVTGIFALASPSFIDVEASGDQRDKHKDNRHDKSKGSSVNVKFICNNINVDGLNIDVNPRDIVSSLAGAQAQEEGNQEVSANSMGNNERNHEFIKQNGGKDFTFICEQNNNGNGNGPPNGVGDCDRCFLPINVPGGIIPPGLLTMLNDYLAEELPAIGDVEGLCELIERLAGTPREVTENQIERLLNAALPGEANTPVIAAIIECLLEENLITPSGPQ